jgi:CRP-like cAMP-binding protein
MAASSGDAKPPGHQQRTFEPGEVIYREDEPADRAYWLERGRVRVFKRVGGTERALRVLGDADVFGDDALLPNAKRQATAVALTAGTALAFDRDSISTLLATRPQLGATLLERLARRARAAEERIQISMLRDSQSKVVLGLLRAAQSLPNPDSSPSLPLSPLDLSVRIGLDVDTVKRTMHQLKEAGYVNVSEERVEISDMSTLQELYGLLETSDEILGGDQ